MARACSLVVPPTWPPIPAMQLSQSRGFGMSYIYSVAALWLCPHEDDKTKVPGQLEAS